MTIWGVMAVVNPEASGIVCWSGGYSCVERNAFGAFVSEADSALDLQLSEDEKEEIVSALLRREDYWVRETWCFVRIDLF